MTGEREGQRLEERRLAMTGENKLLWQNISCANISGL